MFLLVLGGIFTGTALRRVLPENHLSKETQDVVRLGAGLTATIAALVLGLLIGGGHITHAQAPRMVRLGCRSARLSFGSAVARIG